MDETKSLAELSDEDLVERCQDNDHQAFAEIVDRYKHKVHWLVRRMVQGPEDEDLTQEVFVRAYQAMPGFRGKSSFRTWLYRIAHNLCVTELRRRRRRGEHLSLEEEGEEKVHWLLSAPHEDLAHEIERRDISSSVRRLVERLPGPYRTALTLFYLHEVRYEEIGEIMDIPMGTVKTYIHRGRLRLRDLILAESDLAGLTGQPSERGADGEGAHG